MLRFALCFLGLALLSCSVPPREPPVREVPVVVPVAPLAPDEPVDAPDPVQLRHILELAQICAHEAMYLSRDWVEPFADCWAIDKVITNRARDLHTDWFGAARAYSRCSVVSCRDDQHPWTAYLNPEGVVPKHYPNPVLWEQSARDRWLRLYAYATEIVLGTAAARCDREPDHWGSRSKELIDWVRAERAIKAGRWAVVTCPGSLNAFYRVRRRAPRT